ncbi:PPOX class F420-dependent oxidoreductase [Jatrophihabitans fulvus]
MTIALPAELRELVESGPYVHLSTVNPDGSPQVTVVWVGIEDDHLVTAHLGRYAKIRNLEREPRAVLSFLAPATPGEFMHPYAVVNARARVEHTDRAWPLLDRLAKLYVGPDAGFPAPPQDGFLVHYDIERIGGVGPWAPGGR